MRNKILSTFAPLVRNMATSANYKERKVAVLGAAGGIGQPLSLLMKVIFAFNGRIFTTYRAWVAGPVADLGRICVLR
jgi:hypothetical protein